MFLTKFFWTTLFRLEGKLIKLNIKTIELVKSNKVLSSWDLDPLRVERRDIDWAWDRPLLIWCLDGPGSSPIRDEEASSRTLLFICLEGRRPGPSGVGLG